MRRKSSRISLGPISETMLPTLREWRNTYSIFKWCRQFEPISEVAHKTWFNTLETDQTKKMYAVHNEAFELIGVCGLTSIDYINSRAEFSLYIGPEFQGKGYGEAALSELLALAFNVLNLNSVWGESFDENPAMEMFERVGFKKDGVRPQFYFREGKYVDAHLFSITRGDLCLHSDL